MAALTFRRRRRARRAVAYLAIAALVATVAWTAGLFRFAAAIPAQVADPGIRTDAIVVLTGGSGRLAAGLELLSADKAGKLFVSGVYRGVDVDTLLELSQRTPDEIKCCVEIGHSAGNTAGNAAETATWVRDQGYRSLRIVTSNYHMPRTLLEFRHVLPDVMLVPHPVFPENVKQDRWWAWPGTASLIISEYNKVLLAWTGHLGDRLFAGNGAS
jgi:uncharacterized SAM-binding protein YcdF (DUF218 family)